MIVQRLTVHDDDARMAAALASVLERAADGARVTVMTHGFRFEPDHPDHCPHRHILSAKPQRRHYKAVSWARHLHLGRNGAPPGIGFGWQGRGRLNTVYARARTAGDRMGQMIARIVDARPDLRVNIVAHSFGSRVALRALAVAPAGAIDRILLLSAAEYAIPARANASGRPTQIVNVSSGENAVFNLLFRVLVRPTNAGDIHVTGALSDLPNWTDVTIDAPADRRACRRLGFPIRPAPGHPCHWSTYRRGGVFPLYRALLDPARPHVLPALRAALAEERRPLLPDAADWPMLRWQ